MFCAECNAAQVRGAQGRSAEAQELARRIVERLATSPHCTLGDREAVTREVVEAVRGT